MPFTALTRPRISGGVRSCTSEKRITTLTASAAPSTASASSDRIRWVESPNRTVNSPNTEITPNSTWPMGSVSGRRASTTDMISAPTAGAARSSPSPQARS